MKLSVMTSTFGRDIRENRFSYADAIRFCADIGLDAVEVFAREVDSFGEERLTALLAEQNLELSAYIASADFIHSDTQARQRAYQAAQDHIDRAERLGARIVLIVPAPVPGPESYIEGRRLFAEGLQCISQYAREKGITVTTENYGVAVEFNGRIRHLAEFASHAPDLRFTFDAGNFLLAGEDPLEGLERLRDRIAYVHLKDWVPVESEGGRFPVPNRPGCFFQEVAVGEGVVPTFRILDELRRTGYCGYLSIEHGGRIDSRSGLQSAVSRLRDYLYKQSAGQSAGG